MVLKGKVAIVTGGTQGIGLATCRLFAANGAAIVVAGRNAQNGRAVVESIEAAGGVALYVRTDVGRAADVAEMVSRAVDRFGGVDILVNNAGVGNGKLLSETTEDQWDFIIDTNLKGTFLCSTAVLPHMIERGGGAIVNTSSVLALATIRRSGVYSAAKAGIMGLTRSMALEWASYGVRVNCVLPGSTDTPMMWRGVASEDLASRRMAEEEVLPLGRVGVPDEIAQASLWFCSPASSFATGAFLVVDGGALTEYPGPRWDPDHGSSSHIENRRS